VGHYPNDGNKAKLRVLIEPNIGLDGDTRHSIVGILNTMLADEAVLKLKTKSAHWHVRGPGFLDLRNLFGQQFDQLNKMSDEISERVRVLDGLAIASFEEFLNATRLKEKPGEVPDVMDLLADHEASIRFLREDARKCFEEYEDHGTFSLFVRLIRMHEKMAWILRSYIAPARSLVESQRITVRTNLL
jgi:starvation-inducible DNA-binding protein